MSHILAFTIGVIVGINLTIILAMLYAERREMSVSLWAYDPERCDDTVCCGDCDLCMLVDITEEDIEEASPSGRESNPA